MVWKFLKVTIKKERQRSVDFNCITVYFGFTIGLTVQPILNKTFCSSLFFFWLAAPWKQKVWTAGVWAVVSSQTESCALSHHIKDITLFLAEQVEKRLNFYTSLIINQCNNKTMQENKGKAPSFNLNNKNHNKKLLNIYSSSRLIILVWQAGWKLRMKRQRLRVYLLFY